MQSSVLSGKIFVVFSKFHCNLKCFLVRFLFVFSQCHYNIQCFLVRFLFQGLNLLNERRKDKIK